MCAFLAVLRVDSGLDARVLQQACYVVGFSSSYTVHQSRPVVVVYQCRICATVQQGIEDVEGFSYMKRVESSIGPAVHVCAFLVQQSHNQRKSIFVSLIPRWPGTKACVRTCR